MIRTEHIGRLSRGARVVRVFALCLSPLAASGCGAPADGFERFPVEGTVTLDGKDLDSGTINFLAVDKGASASGEIAAGRFRLPQRDGLSPGPYRVEVYSVQATGRKVPDPEDATKLVDERLNVVPERYNIRSELKADIPGGGAREPLLFPLSTNKADGKPPARPRNSS